MKRSTAPTLFALALLLFALLACKGKTRVTAEPTQLQDTVEVKISVSPATAGTAKLKGQAAFEKVGPIQIDTGGSKQVSVPLGEVPLGEYDITVEFTGKGHGLASTTEGKTTFKFKREQVVPPLKLKAGAQAGITTLTCKGDLCEDTSLPLTADAKLSVDLTECDGCSVEIGGQTVKVSGDHTQATFDIAPVIAAAPTSEMRSITTMNVPVKITTDEGSSEAKAEMLGSVLAAVVFRRVHDGPLVFPGNDAAPSAARGVALVNDDARYGVVVIAGSASTGREIDRVGVAKRTKLRLGSCGVYVNSETKARVNVAHTGIRYDVTMYDRRTGKVLGRKSFSPPNVGCYQELRAGVEEITTLPEEEPMQTWASTFLH